MTVRLERTYPTAAVADRILRALAADQGDLVSAEHEGPVLRLFLRATSARTARATLEDLIACVQAAERSIEVTEAGR